MRDLDGESGGHQRERGREGRREGGIGVRSVCEAKVREDEARRAQV
jgi:hypothetical protein